MAAANSDGDHRDADVRPRERGQAVAARPGGVGAEVVPHLLQRLAHGRTLRDARRERSALRAGYRTALMVRSLTGPPPRPSRGERGHFSAWSAGPTLGRLVGTRGRGPAVGAFALVHGVISHSTTTKARSKAMARAIEPTVPTTIGVEKFRDEPVVDEACRSPPSPTSDGHGDQADRGHGGDAQAGDDRRRGQRQVDPQHPAPPLVAHAVGRLAHGRRHAVEPATMFRSRISSV